MIGLVQVEVDQSAMLHLDLFVEVPRHAVDERRRADVLLDLRQCLKEVAVAERNAVQARQALPVSRLVVDAPAIRHPHRSKIIVQLGSVANMDRDAHRLPNTNLVVQFGVGSAAEAWMSNDCNIVHDFCHHGQAGPLNPGADGGEGSLLMHS